MSAPGPLTAGLTACEISAGVRRGERSAVAVVDACLRRIRALEPRVRAFLDVLEREARERAEEIDHRVSRGEDPGPLAGVPVAVKDNLALAGHRLTCGSRILADYRSPFTATAVERLLAAGAVVVGKTNLDEFAMGSSCESSAFGPTRNPWRLEEEPGRVPGGSSGGSAAAVAAGCVPLALGTDTGGSVRQPAAFCGVVGLKPTWGRVSRWGLVAFASSLDQVGPLSRSVADAALALSLMAGPDGRDATCVDRPELEALTPFDAPSHLEGWRVGVIRELREVDGAQRGAGGSDSGSTGWERPWEQALERLRDLGAEVVEVSVPNAPAALAAYQVVASCEASTNLARFDGVRYGRRESAESLRSLYVESRSRGFGAEVKRRILLGTFALAEGYREAYYRRARGVGRALRRQLAAAFERVDVVVTPTTPEAAFGLGERVERPLAMYGSDRFTTLASLTGVPAVAVPSGLDDEGLPRSLQILGRAWDERRILAAAGAFERAAAFRCTPAEPAEETGERG